MCQLLFRIIFDLLKWLCRSYALCIAVRRSAERSIAEWCIVHIVLVIFSQNRYIIKVAGWYPAVMRWWEIFPLNQVLQCFGWSLLVGYDLINLPADG